MDMHWDAETFCDLAGLIGRVGIDQHYFIQERRFIHERFFDHRDNFPDRFLLVQGRVKPG